MVPSYHMAQCWIDINAIPSISAELNFFEAWMLCGMMSLKFRFLNGKSSRPEWVKITTNTYAPVFFFPSTMRRHIFSCRKEGQSCSGVPGCCDKMSCYWKDGYSMFKVRTGCHFQTWLRIGWQLCHQPVRSHVRISTVPNNEFTTESISTMLRYELGCSQAIIF